ncbi:hypothetical protein M8J77_010013 [Diaphorina citri]|nr:hypothetical protein M8J77_010013 [Diaphorina citri]
MAGEVSFKAYLSTEGYNPEVRRFSLDQNVVTSFIYLKEKLRALFPTLARSQSFDIFWKDNDGDLVTICSDDELTIALMESRNEQIMKLFIMNTKPNPAPNTANTKGPSHDGVFCDACEGPISGFRYKCLGCHDYDLCSTCEAKGLHSEHFTLRIPSPLNLRHHFGHRLINKLTKATRKAESRCPWTHRYENNLAADFSTNCTTEETTPPTGRRQCYRPRCERRGSNTSCAGDAGQRGTSEGSTDPKPKATASASITLDPTQIPNVIFNTLADFGIDLSQLFPAPPANQTAGPSTTQTTQTKDETKTTSTTEPKPDESSAPKIAKMTEPLVPSTSAATPAAPALDSNRNSLLAEWTVYNPNAGQEMGEPIEIDLEIETTSSKSSVVGEKETATPPAAATQTTATVQPTAAATQTTTAVPQPTTSATLYPSLAGIPKNKKVAEALDQMLAMGFKNDDGWLTNLLNLQDGNIAKVLDLIQSAAQRK